MLSCVYWEGSIVSKVTNVDVIFVTPRTIQVDGECVSVFLSVA